MYSSLCYSIFIPFAVVCVFDCRCRRCRRHEIIILQVRVAGECTCHRLKFIQLNVKRKRRWRNVLHTKHYFIVRRTDSGAETKTERNFRMHALLVWCTACVCALWVPAQNCRCKRIKKNNIFSCVNCSYNGLGHQKYGVDDSKWKLLNRETERFYL